MVYQMPSRRIKRVGLHYSAFEAQSRDAAALTRFGRAFFCVRAKVGLGRTADSRASYEQALRLAQQGPERRFLESRLHELDRSI